MKYFITLAIILGSLGAMAQKKDQTAIVPDCPPKNSIFTLSPCKVPVIKNGKTVGYTELSYPSYSTLSATGTFGFSSIKPMRYKWVMFSPPYTKPWYIDNPDSSHGKYIMHLDRRNFKWLNDSTAVYSPDSLYKNRK